MRPTKGRISRKGTQQRRPMKRGKAKKQRNAKTVKSHHKNNQKTKTNHDKQQSKEHQKRNGTDKKDTNERKEEERESGPNLKIFVQREISLKNFSIFLPSMRAWEEFLSLAEWVTIDREKSASTRDILP